MENYDDFLLEFLECARGTKNGYAIIVNHMIVVSFVLNESSKLFHTSQITSNV